MNFLEDYLNNYIRSDHFPYSMSTICYFEVDKHSNVSTVPHKNKSDRAHVLEVYQRAVDKTITLYAVWPGKWLV